MPVCAKHVPSSDTAACRTSQCFAHPCGDSLRIGIVNNMGDGALEATEQQFVSLLTAASGGVRIQLSFYSLPTVPRGPQASEHIARYYASTESLLSTHLDGLIVTGREPSTTRLNQEPYWHSFIKLVDWAKDNTYSAVWSCLAAHAAVLHLDGIERVKNDRKQCGLFVCERVSAHPLAAAMPARFTLPHSRWNTLLESSLAEHGYTTLTRSADAGVDTFVKQVGSLFVFLQGHPEYAADTLLLEYRRDIQRYFRYETDTYPSLPQNYFDPEAAASLAALGQESASRSSSALAEMLRTLAHATISPTWRTSGVQLYAGWLSAIAAAKAKAAEERPLVQIGRELGPEAAYSAPALLPSPMPVQPDYLAHELRPAI